MLTWSHISYDRELPHPIVTAHGEYKRRSGLIIRVETEDGVFGLGDVAPLPGFSTESHTDALGQWDSIHATLNGLDVPDTVVALRNSLEHVSGTMELYPSIRFGLETALADCAARRAGESLCRWLSADAEYDVPVNALLRSQDISELSQEFRQRFDDGFRCFKIKVGIGPVATDVQRLRSLRERSEEAQFRPDVNAGWSDEQLREFCRACREANLEFVEQPLPVGQAEAARRITREYGIALALDEEATSVDAGTRLLNDDMCDVLVLKPMTVGGMTGCLELASRARELGKRIVFTSSWESDVGVAATAHLAAACGSVAAVSGLSTAGMIAEGLVSPRLKVERGIIRLTSSPGLGLVLDS